MVLTVALAAGLSVSGAAQPAAAPALKAAFLYNFAKFTAWPPDALQPGAPLAVCTTDAAVFDELARTTAGRSIEGHPVQTQLVTVDSPVVRACHLLYVPGTDAKSAGLLLEALKGAPVLAVGDGDDFVRLGGVAGFFVESGQMRFAVSVEAARRARIELSSKLLSLAKII